jgi:hypothetical protein
MSFDAMQWAFKQVIKPSSVKFVLVSLADFASDDGHAWPSIAKLVEKTCQDRKTIIAAIDKLEVQGFLIDSGERIGSTKQIKKYRFNFDCSNNTESGTVPQNEQSRNSPETVPGIPEKGTVIPSKSADFPPKSAENGTRNLQELSITPNEPTRNPQAIRDPVAAMSLPEWLPQDVWKNWIDHRISIKSAMSEQAAKLTIAALANMRNAGNDPVQIINHSIMLGWRGLFEPRAKPKNDASSGFESNKDRARRQTIAGLTGRNPDAGNRAIIDIN